MSFEKRKEASRITGVRTADLGGSEGMAGGFVSLAPIYDFVCKTPDCITRSSPSIRDFARTRADIVATIPLVRGFYFWGRHANHGDGSRGWHLLYVGQSDKRKTSSLHARIKEELQNERHVFFRAVYTVQDILRHEQTNYPEKFEDYEKQIRRRVLGKSGSTHIIWVATPSLESIEMRSLESALIERLDPVANLQRGHRLPSDEMRQKLAAVLAVYEEQVRASAATGFLVPEPL